MPAFSLVPHPAFPSIAVVAITVAAERAGRMLSLSYAVEGDLAQVAWPTPMPPARTDGLWQHTCFEAFVQPGGGTGYTELNLSPSGRWATYGFNEYREGMREAPRTPSLRWSMPEMAASLELPDADGEWRVGLTAVIEAVDGSKSFWALDHRSAAPDFHDAATFLAVMDG